MFIISNNIQFENFYNNYPKYMIIFNIAEYLDVDFNNFYHYLVSDALYHNRKNKLPHYLVAKDLSLNMSRGINKFDLSKLGTDYLINDVSPHYKHYCIGKYPDNYISVKDFIWPDKEDRTDRTPLKKFKGYLCL